MTDGRHIPEEDLALYSMQALHSADSAALKVHLASCDVCSRELAEVNGDLAALALIVEQQPLPEGARERFVARVTAEKRPVSNVIAMPDPRRRSFIPVLIPWVAAAAMLAVAGYLGVQNRNLDRLLNADRSQIATLSAQASRGQQVMDTLTAPSAQQATLTEGKAAVAPTGHTSYVPDRGALIFVANHLRQVPASKTYELWVIPANGGAPIPAGTFRPDANGTASVVLPPLPQGVPAKAFGVTIENEGGSPTPTMPIVLSGA